MRSLDSPTERRTIIMLMIATLVASAIHFVDNALRLDLYPGPVWLTRNVVLLTWVALPLLAWAAFQVGTRSALVAYALLGFTGLGHYFVSHSHAISPRCTATISSEAIVSTVLIAYVLRPRNRRKPATLE